ncbi:MAG TPA: T9SS type A sorting domain-containing protein, partial [Bacteroidales bacterium]|nr:T9SS type A sorting domain-containing protein [Bacteroidales bacterium]
EIVNAVDKGALAFIGCTNDSYWADDFYWAVGPGFAGIDATYENTGPGAFDRLFHKHNEEPGDWFYTLGQINFAGNMAVSSSTSSRKKYYWETYILLGDPSLSLYIGKPDTFNIQVPDTIPAGLTVLNLFSKPLSYAAISDFDTLWDAKFISPSGNVTLTVPPGVKDSCLLVVTGQNMVPYKKTLYFGPVAGEFLTVENIIYDDLAGNGNGIPDYGEKINLKVTVKNLGEGDAANLTASLSVLSGLITVEQGTDVIGIVAGGGSYTIDNKFIFLVSDEVSDGEMASLLLRLADGNKEFNFGIDMTLNAPDIDIISSVPDDSNTGNANFLPDPGETVMINVRISNTGTSSVSGILTINETSPYLTITSPSSETGLLLPGTAVTIGFEGVISADAIAGTILPFDISLVCGKYSASASYSISTGKTRETWEYNRFDVFPWVHPTNFPWIITSSSAFENVLSARSPLLPDKSESILAITVNNPVRDTLTFFSRISTEVNYDEMIFRVDSVNNLTLSGERPWAKNWVILNPGIHYLEWAYKKDVSLSGGLDAVWLDMITFPDISFLKADLSVDTVFAPVEPVIMNNIIIKGSVINLGSNTLTSFPMAYRINEEEPVNETFFLKIEPGDTLDVSFSEPATFLSGTNYRIEIINRLPEDGYQLNDTAYTSFIKTGINDNEMPSDRLIVSPNPFQKVINLDYKSFASVFIKIEMTDIQGRVVLTQSERVIPGMNRISIDCSDLARGFYTLGITEEGKVIRRKVIKS